MPCIIDQLWKQYNVKGKIPNDHISLLYEDLHKELGLKDEKSLDVIRDFVRVTPELQLRRSDIDYLHEKLVGTKVEDLKATNMNGNQISGKTGADFAVEEEEQVEDDACQILYSPNKKSQKKITPNFEVLPKTDPVKNLFGPFEINFEPESEDISLEKSPTGSEEEEEEEPEELKLKQKRITDLEKVLMELQSYIVKLKDYNEKEIKRIKSKYEDRIIECELKIDDILLNLNKFNGLLRRSRSSRHTTKKSFNDQIPKAVRNSMHWLRSNLMLLVYLSLICMLYLYFGRVIDFIIPYCKISFYLTRTESPNLTSLDRTLKEFSYLIESTE